MNDKAIIIVVFMVLFAFSCLPSSRSQYDDRLIQMREMMDTTQQDYSPEANHRNTPNPSRPKASKTSPPKGKKKTPHAKINGHS
ncbi:hypothetical protein CASFOL_013070 [Castilleja foliolosa]|uniref:Uncharacterized protein n=1 Tax=Castilleja foliolosa TaxID=1961234 RepID=A0ABD3DIW5_9LAMI